MSRTCRWVGLAIALAGLVLSQAPSDALAQKAEEKKVPAQAGRIVVGRVPRPDEPKFSDAVTIPTDRESKRLIQAAQDYIKKKEWRVACECLQSLLEGKEDSFLEVAGADPDGKPLSRRVSVRTEANRLIGELPADGLEFYQVQYGAAAEARLKEALEKNDPAILAEVALRFLHTKAGGEATNLLGTYHLDRGSYLMAALCFERLLSRPDAAKLPFQVYFKASLAARRAGDVAAAEKLFKTMTDKAGRGELALGRQKVTVEQLRREYDRADALLARAGQHDWPIFRGNPARSAQGIGSTAFLEPRWQATMLPLEEPGQVDATNWIRQAVTTAIARLEHKPVLPTFFPIAANGKLVYRTYDGIYAVSLRDTETADGKVKAGGLLWAANALGGLHGMANRADRKHQLELWFNTYYANQSVGPISVLFENSIIGSLSHDDERVYFVDDLAVPPHPSMVGTVNFGAAAPNFGVFNDEVQFSRLVAVELETGKLRWTVGGRGAGTTRDRDDRKDAALTAADLTDTFFLGPPLPLAGKLYLLVEKQTELKLICLDPARLDAAGLPELVWQQTLGTANNRLPQDSMRRLQAAHLAYADGILVCPTNAGVVLGVDLLTHSLVWAHSYREGGAQPTPEEMQGMMRGGRFGRVPASAMLPQDRWRTSAPIIQDGKVVFTAYDGTAGLHCLNLRDGRLLWHVKREDDDLFLAGVFGPRVVIVGKTSVRALNLTDGQPLWGRVPTDSLPSGQGAASDDVYYLPLQKTGPAQNQGPGVLALNLITGKPVSVPARSKKEAVGNLLFVDGEMISQTALQVAAFPQLRVKKDEYTRRLKENPNDAVGRTERGELFLYEGQLRAAIDDLRTALAHAPPPDSRAKARVKLHEAYTELFQTDFAAAEPFLEEYRDLCRIDIPEDAEPAAKQRLADEQLRREANFLSLVGRGRERQGRLLDAFAAYEQFGALTGNQELVSVIDEPHTKSRPDVWSRGRIKGMIDRATPAQRQQLEEAIAKRYEAVRAKNDVAELRKFVAVFGVHFRVGRAAQIDLAERLLAAGTPDDLTEAEAKLKAICFSGELRQQDPPAAARAIEAMARVCIRRGLYEDAVGFFKQLGAEFAAVEVRDGKTGADFLGELNTDKRFLPYLEPQGLTWKGALRPHVSSGSFQLLQTSLTLEPQGADLPFFDRRRVVLDVNLQGGKEWAVRLLDRGTNEELWKKAGLPAAGYVVSRSGPPPQFAYVSGHLLVLHLNSTVFALDLANHQELWKFDLFGKNRLLYGDNANRNLMLDGDRLTLASADNRNQLIGGVGVVESSYVCLQTREGLVALDPHRPGPSVLWTKSDVSVKARVFGDDQHVYVVEPAVDGAAPVGRALRAQDGVSVPVPDFGPLFPKQPPRTVGRCLLLHEDTKDGKTLRLYDVHTGRDVWRQDFAAGATVMRSEDPELLGVCERDRTVTVLEARTGAVRFKSLLQPDHAERLQEVTLFGDHDRVYLATHRAAENGLTWRANTAYGLRSVKLHGAVYALNRGTGKLEWVCDFLPHQALVLEQVRDLPMLLFTSQYTKTSANGTNERQAVKVTGVDKRTGKLIYDNDFTHHSDFHSLRTDPIAGTIELVRQDLKITFRAGDAVPAAATVDGPGLTPVRVRGSVLPGGG